MYSIAPLHASVKIKQYTVVVVAIALHSRNPIT